MGMGMGSSPVPMGQHLMAQPTGMMSPMNSQPTGMMQNNGPRGPFAPVPGNQGLLNPLVPTTTGFNSFVPTRPVSVGASPFANPPGAQPSFLQTQPTGFNMGGGSLMAQSTGFGGQQGGFGMGQQPTGFGGQVSLMAQPTGMQMSNSMGSFGQPQSGSLMAQPTGFNAGGQFQNGSGFNGVQTNPTGFNPGFGQFNANMGPPAQAPTKDVSPANIFAQMKSGTFGDDAAPQEANRYDALRPQPTGWNNGYQQQQQTGFGYR